MERYEKYKDSGVEWIGEIPEGWEVKKLKYVMTEHTGNGFPNSEQGNQGANIPFYKVSDINGKLMFVDRANNYVSFETATNNNWNIIPKHSVIAAKIGEALKKNHRKITLLDCIIDNNCIALEAKGIDYKYNFYLLSLVDFTWFVNPGAVPSLSVEKLKDCKISIPDRKKEQTTIANYLDRKTAEIDQLIAQKERLLSLYEEEKTAIINQAVTQGINPDVKLKDSGIDWLGEIPEHWEVKKLKYVADANPSNIDKKRKDNEETVLLCNYVDVYKNEFISNELNFMNATASEDQIRKFILEKGDVVATKDSETPDDIATPALVVENFDNVVCGYHLTHIKPKKINGEYLFRYFQTKYLNSYFEVSANGVTRYGLGVDKFNSALILNPPKPEQTAIVQHIETETSRINAKITKTKKIIALQKEYRTALINEVVTGKIKVTQEVTS